MNHASNENAEVQMSVLDDEEGVNRGATQGTIKTDHISNDKVRVIQYYVGDKRHPSTYYICGGYGYSRNRIAKNKAYFRCCNRYQKNCPAVARGNVDESGTVTDITLTRPHLSVDASCQEQCQLVQLKHDCLKMVSDREEINHRHIINSVICRYPNLKRDVVKNLLRCLHLRRISKPPCQPANIYEFVNVLRRSHRFRYSKYGNRFFHGEVGDSESGVAVIFLSDFARAGVARTALVEDGVAAPPAARGIFSNFLLAHKYDESSKSLCCFAFVLMENRSQELYFEVFRELAEKCDFWPDRLICDFDETLRSALSLVLVDTPLLGCSFHFGRALRRMISRLGLWKDMRDNVEIDRVLRMLFALPFLPAGSVRRGLTEIRARAAKLHLTPKQNQLLNQQVLGSYMDEFWKLVGGGAESISVGGDYLRIADVCGRIRQEILRRHQSEEHGDGSSNESNGRSQIKSNGCDWSDSEPSDRNPTDDTIWRFVGSLLSASARYLPKLDISGDEEPEVPGFDLAGHPVTSGSDLAGHPVTSGPDRIPEANRFSSGLVLKQETPDSDRASNPEPPDYARVSKQETSTSGQRDIRTPGQPSEQEMPTSGQRDIYTSGQRPEHATTTSGLQPDVSLSSEHRRIRRIIDSSTKFNPASSSRELLRYLSRLGHCALHYTVLKDSFSKSSLDEPALKVMKTEQLSPTRCNYPESS